MQRIFLIGFMGSGKSTLGRQLAEKLNYTFLETDQLVEQNVGLKITEIFEKFGEDYFRKKEHDILIQLQLVHNCIIATGGGMPCYFNNMELLNELGTTIWLEVDELTLVDRLKNETSERPLLQQSQNLHQRIHELLDQRKKFYDGSKYVINNPTVEKILEVL